MLIKKSIEHLNHNNMGYWQHFKFAFFHGLRCIKAGILLAIHSIIPALFPRSGSILVNKLNQDFTEHNDWLELKNKMEAFKNIYKSNE